MSKPSATQTKDHVALLGQSRCIGLRRVWFNKHFRLLTWFCINATFTCPEKVLRNVLIMPVRVYTAVWDHGSIVGTLCVEVYLSGCVCGGARWALDCHCSTVPCEVLYCNFKILCCVFPEVSGVWAFQNAKTPIPLTLAKSSFSWCTLIKRVEQWHLQQTGSTVSSKLN